jgi:hypothetical protein
MHHVVKYAIAAASVAVSLGVRGSPQWRVVPASERLQLHVSLIGQRSCLQEGDPDIYGENLTVRTKYENVGSELVTVFLNSAYVAGWSAARSVRDLEAGSVDAKFEADLHDPARSRDRPVVVEPKRSVTDQSGLTVFVRRDRNRPRLPFAIDSGQYHMKITIELRVYSGSPVGGPGQQRMRPPLSDWTSLVAANLLPFSVPARPTLVDCNR